MARNRSKPSGGSAVRTSIKQDKATTFVERIEATQAEIDGIMAVAKSDCAPLRETIAAIKKEAHGAGAPRLEFNAILRKRRLLGKIEAIRPGLSEDQRDNFDALDLFLGDLDDTPLGLAAGRKGSADQEAALAH